MKSRRKNPDLVLGNPLFPVKPRKRIPHEFALDAISALSPRTRPMFGCLAVYVADKIVFVLRDKPEPQADNGVWLATTPEHHQSLRRTFPNMRSIEVLGKKVTGWQVLPADAPDFEEAALHACELVLAEDPRIGKVPGPRNAKSSPKRVTDHSQSRAKIAEKDPESQRGGLRATSSGPRSLDKRKKAQSEGRSPRKNAQR